jgi:hypothetical protein
VQLPYWCFNIFYVSALYTIILSNLILTSFHCFWNIKLRTVLAQTGQFKNVLVGKNDRNYPKKSRKSTSISLLILSSWAWDLASAMSSFSQLSSQLPSQLIHCLAQALAIQALIFGSWTTFDLFELVLRGANVISNTRFIFNFRLLGIGHVYKHV